MILHLRENLKNEHKDMVRELWREGYDELHEALVKDKGPIERFDLKKSIAYNHTYLKEHAKEISDTEIKQENELIKNMALMKEQQRQNYFLRTEKRKMLESKGEKE